MLLVCGQTKGCRYSNSDLNNEYKKALIPIDPITIKVCQVDIPSAHDGHFYYMKIDKDTIARARVQYPFLEDRKDHI